LVYVRSPGDAATFACTEGGAVSVIVGAASAAKGNNAAATPAICRTDNTSTARNRFIFHSPELPDLNQIDLVAKMATTCAKVNYRCC
jgi:hypothetical protein